MKTQLSESLGIEFPIFAFSHCRDVVAAVTNAGGFGVLGALAFTPEQLAVELDWIDSHVGGNRMAWTWSCRRPTRARATFRPTPPMPSSPRYSTSSSRRGIAGT